MHNNGKIEKMNSFPNYIENNLTHLHYIKTTWKLPLCLKSQNDCLKFDFGLILVELQVFQKGGKLGICA